MALLPKIPTPQNYFKGVRFKHPCRVDNLLMFVREEQNNLSQSSFESRPHHRYVLIVNFETAGAVNVDGSVFRIHPGEAFLIAPYQFHFYMDIESPTIQWLFITFEAVDKEAYEPLLNTPVKLGKTEIDETKNLVNSYANLSKANPNAANLFTLSAEILITKIRALCEAQSESLIAPLAHASPSHTLVDKINHLLVERLEDGINISQLATLVSSSESHLRKQFKSLTGLSLGSYLVHYKLNRAVKLLVHSKSSLTDISIACGYESLAAFSRGFKAKLGASPSEYRKSARKL